MKKNVDFDDNDREMKIVESVEKEENVVEYVIESMYIF